MPPSLNVHEILTKTDREVSANRSWCGILRVRRTHETSYDLPRVSGAFHDGHQ